MKYRTAGLIVVAFHGVLYAGPIYQIVDLGPAAGVGGINSSGEIAGWRSDSSGQPRAFLSNGNSSADLTTSLSMAAAVSATGQVAGTYWTTGGAHAVIWDSGPAADLGTLGGAESYATAINSRGQVAGNAMTTSGTGHAFLYSDGVMQDLGTPAGAFWSSAYGINDTGVVAGYSLASGGRFRAFQWTAADGFTSLGTLGGQNSYAMAVSSASAIAGHAQNTSGMLHAFLYADSTMVDLGTLGGWQSFAYGVNASNHVAGYSQLSSGGTHAFVYRDGFLYDLNALTSAAGWELTDARAINDVGQIAGTGVYNGELHAYRLDPISSVHSPEPASYLLTGGAILLIASRLLTIVDK